MTKTKQNETEQKPKEIPNAMALTLPDIKTSDKSTAMQKIGCLCRAPNEGVEMPVTRWGGYINTHNHNSLTFTYIKSS